jgi:hypothetical protein
MVLLSLQAQVLSYALAVTASAETRTNKSDEIVICLAVFCELIGRDELPLVIISALHSRAARAGRTGSPWSVPRLRGRGEQGEIVRRTPLYPRSTSRPRFPLVRRSIPTFHTKKRGGPIGLAHCGLCSPRPRKRGTLHGGRSRVLTSLSLRSLRSFSAILLS